MNSFVLILKIKICF